MSFGVSAIIFCIFLLVLIIILFICLSFPQKTFNANIYTREQSSGFVMKNYVNVRYNDISTASVTINGMTFSLIGGIYSQGRNVFTNNFYFNNGTWNRISSLNDSIITNKEIININLILISGETKMTWKRIGTNGQVLEFGMIPNSAEATLVSPLL
jgi:hypothetical protein